MGLLACGTSSVLYPDLLSEDRWLELLLMFRDDALQIHDLPRSPLLYTVLSAGLSALKTNVCGSSNSRHGNCPACYAGGLDVLADSLPFNHRENSILLCRISGSPMDDNNPPMCLPNGQVYSKGSLEKISSQSHDKKTVTCPQTGESFPLSASRLMYIM